MKWPKSVTLIRHDTSEYNILRYLKREDALYKRFLFEFKHRHDRELLVELAVEVQEKFGLKMGDADTKLADKDGCQAFETGLALSKKAELPDVVFVSPYTRAILTYEHILRGWPALHSVKMYEEERIREQEHGLALLYSDWRVFHVLHPEQEALYKMEGPYWYRYPQGENIPDVRERNRSWTKTLVRDFAEKRVLAITHHLNILAFRANMERLSSGNFIDIDENGKPINCGVTIYEGEPDQGKDGRLVLKNYNQKLYS